jgi:hypothetical protein
MYGCVEEAERQFLTKHDELTIFFKHHKSPVPNVMSLAVLETKNPNLMASISVVESNGTPWAVGDGGASLGAFQVQPIHHGRVSLENVSLQARQAERVLFGWERLRCKRKMLATYNGGNKRPKASYRYADKVLKLEKTLA